jgi:hypothetical protein
MSFGGTQLSWDRRQFLQTTAAFAAAGFAAPVVSADIKTTEVEARSGDYWKGFFRMAQWTDMVLEVSSYAFGGIDLDFQALNSFQNRICPAREGVKKQADIQFNFFRHPGDFPLLDARLPSGETMFMLPGEMTMLSRAWLEKEFCYEEWAVRGLLGSYLHDFPFCLDFADLRQALFSPPTRERLTVGALQSNQNIRLAALGAFRDAEQMLSYQGFRTDAVYSTYHGAIRLTALGEISETLNSHCATVLVGNDWNETWDIPSVSVFVSGYREQRSEVTNGMTST